MNSFPNTTGEYIKKSVIDGRVSRMKGVKLEQQRDENPEGYFNYCSNPACKMVNVRLDVSHIESVNDCQNNGYCEKSWDLDNMQILCRKCHQLHDGLNLSFS